MLSLDYVGGEIVKMNFDPLSFLASAAVSEHFAISLLSILCIFPSFCSEHSAAPSQKLDWQGEKMIKLVHLMFTIYYSVNFIKARNHAKFTWPIYSNHPANSSHNRWPSRCDAEKAVQSNLAVLACRL